VLVGPAAVIAEARRYRKMVGGGMRQAGVLAAAGLVSLRMGVERLAEDHRRARRLADVVADRWAPAGFDPDCIRTNCVTFIVPDPGALLRHLRTEGVLAGTIAPGVVRLMTHHDVDDAGLARAIDALACAP
jgi:threonine aldolase